MKENIDELFYQEIREKKTTATGVHGKKGKKGRAGKMVTPADISSREYREARDLPSFNVYDFIHKLHEAPTLKSVLLARMEEEYKTYRQATEKALDATAEILQMGMEPLYNEVRLLQQQVANLAHQLDILRNVGRTDAVDMSEPLTARQGSAAPVPLPTRGQVALVGKKRIRWGSNPETIRETVFDQLRHLTQQGEEITTETIKQRIPSMLRWIYGERAVFDGIDGLRREFLACEKARTSDANPAFTPPVDPAAPEEMPGGGVQVMPTEVVTTELPSEELA